MDFEYDIFVCFAPEGDDTIESAKEWSVKFSQFLDNLLNRILHKKPVILTNSDLDVRKKMLNTSTSEILSKTAIFVTILSPEYLKSERYQDKLKTIYDTVYGSEEHNIENPTRIFKVVTSPVPLEEQPETLQGELNYDFYEVNPKTGRVKELDISDDSELNCNFWSKLVDLGYDISNSLSLIKSGEKITKNKNSDKSIFLAETTPDRNENRDEIKRELQQLGYNIVPNIQLPHESEKLNSVIKKYLENANLSIHVMGGYYGDYITNSQYSLIDFQNRTVKDFIKNNSEENLQKNNFSRIIWIPPDLRPSDERQVLYIARLKRDDAFKRSEIVETPIEELKSIINNKLLENETNEPLENSKKSVYLIHEKIHSEEIKSLTSFLESNNLEVLTPEFNEKEKNIIEEHIKRMVKSDGIILYYRNNNSHWINSKLNDITKAPGYGKTNEFISKCIVTDLELTDQVMQKKGDIEILNIQGNSINEQLDSFITNLTK